MNSRVFFYLLLLFSVFISSVSQVLLKKAALNQYNSVLKEYFNPMVIIAYSMFFGATLLTVFSYKVVPLSMGPILEATSYLYVTLFDRVFFEARISVRKIVALFTIIIGIVIYTVFG